MTFRWFNPATWKMMKDRFQSLFCWNDFQMNKVKHEVQNNDWFQSLFCWNDFQMEYDVCLVNHDRLVSILILLEWLSDEAIRNHCFTRTCVSILILLEWLSDADCVDLAWAGRLVSILILLEWLSDVDRNSLEKLLSTLFQSLFCWNDFQMCTSSSW